MASIWRNKNGEHSATSSFSGSAIFRRAAFHDVADVDVFSLQAHRFDHLRQKFSGAADEGEALHVFIVAGAFADKNQFGFGIAVAEDDFVACFVKFAARAFAEIGANLEKRVAGNFVKCFEQRWPCGTGKDRASVRTWEAH